jgi:hypothetical protein
LLALLAVGLAGTGAELLLLEHTEEFWQLVPVVLLPLGLVVTVVFGLLPRRATLRVFQLVMTLVAVAGGLGLYQHYAGNVAFELEMAPSLGGWELFRMSMMGATPALAPGSMAQLGLLGLACAFHHPVTRER